MSQIARKIAIKLSISAFKNCKSVIFMFSNNSGFLFSFTRKSSSIWEIFLYEIKLERWTKAARIVEAFTDDTIFKANITKECASRYWLKKFRLDPHK